MEQQDPRAMLSARQEIGEVSGHRVVIMAHQDTARLPRACQHLYIGDTRESRCVRSLDVHEGLTTKDTLDNKSIEVGVGLKANTLAHNWLRRSLLGADCRETLHSAQNRWLQRRRVAPRTVRLPRLAPDQPQLDDRDSRPTRHTPQPAEALSKPRGSPQRSAHRARARLATPTAHATRGHTVHCRVFPHRDVLHRSSP